MPSKAQQNASKAYQQRKSHEKSIRSVALTELLGRGQVEDLERSQHSWEDRASAALAEGLQQFLHNNPTNKSRDYIYWEVMSAREIQIATGELSWPSSWPRSPEISSS
jgi:hypothetical protein